ncbi:MAG: hypothetical protein ACOCYB_02555 [Alkalispirochaeta sp.]
MEDTIVSEPTSNKVGGRVFRIDRECYVIYVGSDDHRVRPFLRVGTSSHLPDRIRPYIGTVVLSDRVTGNPLQEAETVGAVGPRRPEYTGSPELVHAFSPLTGMERVRERPISSSHRRLPQGAFVEFLSDGNLYLTVNAHRIYELDEVEQRDRHDAYRMERVAAAVTSSGGAYRRELFEPAGFLVGTDRSLFRFSHGQLTATALQSGGLEALSRRLIDPDLLSAVAGPVDPEALLRWGKWRLRRALVAGAMQPVIVAREASASETPRRLDHLLDVLRVAGLPMEYAPVSREFDLSEIPGEPTETTLRVSGRGEWPAAPEYLFEGRVPVVPGVPYRVFSGVDTLPEGTAAGEDPGNADRDRDDAYGRLMTELHRWNAAGGDETDVSPERFVQRVSDLLAACPAPIWADLYPSGEGYSVRFMVQHGFSLKFVRENVTAVERIDTALDDPDSLDNLFRDEQRRLLAFLDELLEQRRATTRPPPDPTPAETAAAPSTSAAAPAAETPAAASQATEDTAAASQPATPAASTPASAASPAASKSAAAGSPAAAQSPRDSRPGAEPVAAARAGSSRGGGGVGTGSAARSATGMWRGPTFVVLGVVLIAGAVALLLWRDDSGERLLARLGARSEAALVADDVDGENDGEDAVATDDATRGDTAMNGDNDSADGVDPSEQPHAEDGADGATRRDGGSDSAEALDSPDSADSADSPDSADSADSPDSARAGNTANTATDGDEAPDEVVRDDPTTQLASDDQAPSADAPITVTVSDILRMVNRIAELNGYAPIGSMAPDARDPDWIFPGNQLELPNQEVYEIRRGDTMWAIADRFIRQSEQEHIRRLADLRERVQQGEQPTEELRVLLEESYVETTRRSAGELLSEIGVE